MRHALRSTLVALFLSAVVLAQPLSVHAEEAPEPVGMNAVSEVLTFAMAHPFRFGDTPAMNAARDYLVAKLESYGYEVERHTYLGGTNIVGIKRGTERPHDWLTVTAHYDTVMVPVNGIFGGTVNGAWDDGAGVAAGLELARAASEREWKNTLAFVFFDDEEAGLVGSRHFVNDYDNKAWEGGRIRLIGNLNMDPPGLNYPCVADGIYIPVAMFEAHSTGAGQELLRGYMFKNKDAAGVPANAFQFFRGGVEVGLISGSSDNVRFAQRGIPEMYIGSSTHLFIGETQVKTMYPLHTPADTLATMIAFCGGNVLTLADGFGVAMSIVWNTMLDVDSYDGAFPRP